MAKLRAMKRNFCFSQQQLINRALKLSAACERDLSRLTNIGFTPDMLKNLTEMNAEFMRMNPDRGFLKEIATLTDRRKAIKKEIVKQIRIIQLRLEILGCQQSDIYNLLKNIKVHNVSDEVFLSGMRQIQSCGVKLCSMGVSASLTGTLNGLINDFKKQLESLAKLNADRKNDSESRISLANNIISLMGRICKMGKLLWKDTDEAKYKDYVLY
ncbi:MAG: hypothetical protein J6V76_07710 [Bacteroidales bacterium]|nr:hypothetical protein [Bacteroidales bacterium]